MTSDPNLAWVNDNSNMLQGSTESEAVWKARVKDNGDSLTADQISVLNHRMGHQPPNAKYHQTSVWY